MDILIKHCNNLDEAHITFQPGMLNIKYGANGTGKSTIAKAIELSAKGDLSSLRPFKYRGSVQPGKESSILGAEGFKSIAVFNETYVNQFVFKQDEVLQNSFEVFIRNADYEAKMQQIEQLVADIQSTFKNNDNIELVIKDLTELSDSFGKSQTGFSKAGRIGKGLGNGNKLEHIPEKLASYSNFIRSSSNVKWIKWQIEGNQYLNISSDCPYCTSSTDGKKESILAVSEEYDAKSIEHLTILQGILDRLGKYFSNDTAAEIAKIVKNKTGLKKEEIAYLTTMKMQVDILIEKLQDIRSISFFTLRDVDKVQARISELKIALPMLNHLESADTKAIVEQVNAALDSVLEKAGDLQGEINKQKKSIETTIKKHKQEINEFLKYAGYKYTVDILGDANSYKMKLRHVEYSEHVESGDTYLSYGEKNAFSIVLFMYECLSKNPDLIVLDDPISSFDKSKKFAILKMLFRGKGSLQGRNVLMLTHDIEPIIDMVKSLAHTFQPPPVAHFLKTRSGFLTEQSITKNDIGSFAQICNQNIAGHHDEIIKSIYLRRYFEIADNKGLEYQLLSNLLHKRVAPTISDAGAERPMTPEEIERASSAICVKLPDFDYKLLVSRCLDKKVMKDSYERAHNNYEKLQLFRIMSDDRHDNDVIMKYINESFHIENDYIMQLNPHTYDFVPEHIVRECDDWLLNS